jgi:alpha-amylase
MSYAIWGPTGISGGFNSPKRRTTQEFQLDDDLGDTHENTPGYGGKITSDRFRMAGSVWAAEDTPIKVNVYTDGGRTVNLRVFNPDDEGKKSTTSGHHEISGATSNTEPLTLELTAEQEGYHQLAARLAEDDEQPTRAYVKATYEAPAVSNKF